MPVYLEDPTQLSKSRLKSDLIAHNVELPPSESKKEVYLDLHLKHIYHKNAAGFSSDEEDLVKEAAEEEEDPKMWAPSELTDDELRCMLLKHGVKPGPINAFRHLYEKKLEKLLDPDAQPTVNDTNGAALYSDSEDGEMESEDKEEEESGSEPEDRETVSNKEQSQQESSQEEIHVQSGGHFYHRCFLPSSRLRVPTLKRWEPCPKRNAENVVESPAEWGLAHIPSGLSMNLSIDLPKRLESGVSAVVPADGSTSASETFSIAQLVEEMESRNTASSVDMGRNGDGCNLQEHQGKSRWLQPLKVDKYTMMDQSLPDASPYEPKIKPPQELVPDILSDVFPDAVPTPTGMSATRRRPIKGAAGRPVQYKYPDVPLSPATQEMREIERHLVPVYVQVLVFLIVACLLFFIYACVEDVSCNPILAVLDGVSQETDEEPLSPAETWDSPVFTKEDI